MKIWVLTLRYSYLRLLSWIQPKQRTSLSSSLDVQRPVNHSCEPSEVSSSLGYASFSTSPPASPPLSPNQEDSTGSNDDCQLTGNSQSRRECGRAIVIEVHLSEMGLLTLYSKLFSQKSTCHSRLVYGRWPTNHDLHHHCLQMPIWGYFVSSKYI